MPSTELVSLGHFAGSNQVSQRFVRCVRYPHRRQISAITARQFRSVTPISLYAITRLHRDQTWRNDIALHAECDQLPIQHVPSGPGLVADAKMLDRSKLANQLSNRLVAVGNDTQGTEFPVGFKNSDCDRFRVDIKTHKFYFTHWPAPFACGSVPLARRNPRIRDLSRPFHVD